MSTPSFVVVGASPAYAEVLAAIHKDGFDTPWSAKTFFDLLGQPNVHGWIADEPNPSGFILIRTAVDEAEILTLAVANTRRRAGIGRTLVKHAMAWLKTMQVAVCHLEVAADNTAAQRLYTEFGFTESGRRPGYYQRSGARADALLMACLISHDA